jgi:hypothetical protein
MSRTLLVLIACMFVGMVAALQSTLLTSPAGAQQPAGPITLVNRASGVVLSIDNNAITRNGTKAVQWDFHGIDQNGHQQWTLVPIDGGRVWLKNKASGKALSIDDNRIKDDGALAVQWDYHGNEQDGHQQWSLEKVSEEKKDEGWVWLKNRASGKALSVICQDIAKNGAGVTQWVYHKSANQQWRIDPNPQAARFAFGPFEFDATKFPPDQICLLLEKHRLAYAAIDRPGILNQDEKDRLRATYRRAIKHEECTNQDRLGEAKTGGDTIGVHQQAFAHPKVIAKVLIHEMMHCAGFEHKAEYGTDDYNKCAPVRAERCLDDTFIHWDPNGGGLTDRPQKAGWCGDPPRRP